MLYLDQNLMPDAALRLRQLGHDVLRAADLGYQRAEDAEHLLNAAHLRRVLVTKDRDFRGLQVGWRLWAADWGVRPTPQHAGFLLTPGHWSAVTIAQEVTAFFGLGLRLENVLYEYDDKQSLGWVLH
jgi:hypothetical protein